MKNPLLKNNGLPNFADIAPKHVEPAIDASLKDFTPRLEAIEANNNSPTWQNLVEPLAALEEELHRVWGPVSHLHGVKNSPELRKVYQSEQRRIVEFSLRISQSRAIYDRLLALRNGSEWTTLSAAQKRSIEARLLAAKHSGVGLDGPKQAEFSTLRQKLSQLASQFSNNVLDSNKAFELVLSEARDAEGFPASLRELSSQNYQERHAKASTPEEGPWLITLDPPVFVPFMEYCRNASLREAVYRAYISRASRENLANQDNIVATLKARRRIAAILGYKSYAELSLAEKMVSSVAQVDEFSEQLRSSSFAGAKREYKELCEFAAHAGGPEKLRHWDIAYWSKRLQEQRFSFTDEEIRPYFSLEQVLDGMFAVAKQLFNVTVKSDDTNAVERWHEDVRFFRVYDEHGHELAAFFLDPYSRPQNKRGGAWMDECIGRAKLNGQVIRPVAYLVCNFSPPTTGTPSLLTFPEVTTLFHEFGHGLQHMLTTVDYLDVAGIRGVEWDAVELPSQFMENWCYHSATIEGMARHYRSGEGLAKHYIDKLIATRKFRAASAMVRQLQFGMIDMAVHGDRDFDDIEDVFDLYRQIVKRTSVLEPLQEDYFLCSFSHIFAGGYAAGYYSYKWAEIMSADAFAAFEEVGLDDASAVASLGRKFRQTVLALGGGCPPAEVFAKFRGRPPTTDALLRHYGLAAAGAVGAS